MCVARFILRLSDGGEVALDWGELHDAGRTPDSGTTPTTTPVLLIIPGITGCNMDNYVQHLVEDALLEGYRPVVFNQRGNGGLKLKVSGVRLMECIHLEVRTGPKS